MSKHELTVTLRPIMYNKTAQEQFIQTSAYMKTILAGRKNSTIAELTQENNVHYHSIVEIKNSKDKDSLMNKFRNYNKFLGRKSCRMVQYEESYERYIIKSIKVTQEIIPDPVVKDDYKVMDIYSKLNSISEAPSRSDEVMSPLGQPSPAMGESNAREPSSFKLTPALEYFSGKF